MTVLVTCANRDWGRKPISEMHAIIAILCLYIEPYRSVFHDLQLRSLETPKCIQFTTPSAKESQKPKALQYPKTALSTFGIVLLRTMTCASSVRSYGHQVIVT